MISSSNVQRQPPFLLVSHLARDLAPIPAVPGLVHCQANRLSLSAGVVVDAWIQRVVLGVITLGGRQTADRDELRLLSIETLVGVELAHDRPGSALAIALLAARDDPLWESAHRLVIQAHLAQGNLAEAAHQYMPYRAQLWDDLRLRPSLGMVELIHPIKPGVSLIPHLQIAR